MATKKEKAPAEGIVLKAPDNVESVGTEAGVLECRDGTLVLPDDAEGRALAGRLCLHGGFRKVAG